MIGADHGLTPGYVVRHVPPGSKIGIDVAVLDIAQDFLLAHLAERGVLGDLAIFKGGTALRKLFAGAHGRFSTDMDLASREPEADRHALAEIIAGELDVALGPFRFRPSRTRGRWHIAVESPFGNPAPSIKLDVGPPTWLESEPRPFVPHVTHDRYGLTLPTIPSARLEEILAEKIARLTRSGTARDASDLVWAATTSPHSGFSINRVRRLAMIRVWVDNHGLGPAWASALSPRPFDPERWLSPREDWDDEQIGLLTHPPPSLSELEAKLHRLYAWLRDLTEEEGRLASADARDRSEVIRAVRDLDHSALTSNGHTALVKVNPARWNCLEMQFTPCGIAPGA